MPTFKTCVLMSCFNGEKFVAEQIDSIFNQRNTEILLLVRDDASTDNTVSILERYEEIYRDKIIVIKGEKNIGWQDSFLTLLYEAKKYNYKYYAFSDQDDIWPDNRIEKACLAIETAYRVDCHRPILCYGNQIIIDSQNNELYEVKEYKDWFEKETAKYRVCLDGQCVTLGCCMVFNKMLLDKATSNSIDIVLNNKISHDQWISGVAAYFGKVVFCDDIFTFHRRHDKSISNSGKRKRKKIRKKYMNYGKIYSRFFGNDLLNEDENFLQLVSEHREIKKKLSLIKNKKFRYDSLCSNLKLWFQIMADEY